MYVFVQKNANKLLNRVSSGGVESVFVVQIVVQLWTEPSEMTGVSPAPEDADDHLLQPLPNAVGPSQHQCEGQTAMTWQTNPVYSSMLKTVCEKCLRHSEILGKGRSSVSPCRLESVHPELLGSKGFGSYQVQFHAAVKTHTLYHQMYWLTSTRIWTEVPKLRKSWSCNRCKRWSHI